MTMRGELGYFIPDESEEAQARRNRLKKKAVRESLDPIADKNAIEDSILDRIEAGADLVEPIKENESSMAEQEETEGEQLWHAEGYAPESTEPVDHRYESLNPGESLPVKEGIRARHHAKFDDEKMIRTARNSGHKPSHGEGAESARIRKARKTKRSI